MDTHLPRFLDQESSAASEAEDHESEDDNDGRESFTVNYWATFSFLK